ncbi:MAG: hypothetical protein KA436_02270 [Oligoflexales bacterium]|nr:hypothetical protein [Oligoflexales bacterium]
MEGQEDQFSYLLSISDLAVTENVRIMAKGGIIGVLKRAIIFPIFNGTFFHVNGTFFNQIELKDENILINSR